MAKNLLTSEKIKETKDVILIRLGNVDNYYVHSAFLMYEESQQKLNMRVHNGIMQDSIVIDNDNLTIRLGCYITPGCLNFYRWRIAGQKVCFENMGDTDIRIQTPHGEFKVKPEERVMVNEPIY